MPAVRLRDYNVARPNMFNRFGPFLVLVAAAVSSCGGERRDREAASSSREPMEERPLETESIEVEDVPVLEAPAPRPRARGPCGWARAWEDPGVPDPVLAGGGLALERIEAAEIRLPVREGARGEATVEIVVGPEGTVTESRVVRGFEPAWPEAEEAILSAVRRFRYQPPRLDGTPVSVCSTFQIRP